MEKGIGIEFMRKTCYDMQPPSDQSRHLPAPPLETEYDLSIDLISLVKPEKIHIDQNSLRESIEKRQPLTIPSEFIYLLLCFISSQGLQ